ncbi:Fanconi anemia group I protein [Amphibalanus amphitrite]|uniref:Fanconi anemia group I protein n=2 Tax=Amphibalanus amphitrite TaxID=1232801 RepID=A0A6A4WWP4_AMPAM|nr:Fanconi anemia group I protein-like isoform X1 [Amphibalanus amphitrite]XP_043206245.1 Fanconi anemia group I protein-like isoform X1 [Amphibalanus amphitrite]KAF0306828.1 Fanconi anemia group I protein [Amphibalanus amphitrite]
MAGLDALIKDCCKDEGELRSLLSRASAGELKHAVLNITKSPDASSVLNSAISSLNSDSMQTKRLDLITACVDALKSESIDAQCSRDVTGMLLLQLSSLPSSSVARLTKQFVSSITRSEPLTGRWVELFPKLLAMLSEFPELEYDGATIAGSVARAEVLAAVWRAELTAPTATRLVEVLRDQRMAADELDAVLDAVRGLLRRLEVQDVPPLVYQLVRLCSGPAGARLLHLLLDHFAKQEERLRAKGEEDTRAAANLRQAEGTVIYHVTHAPCLEQGLVKEFARHVRASVQCPARLLTPFSLALALALAGGESHAQTVLDALVSALGRSARETALREESRWLRDAAPPPVDAERLLLEAAALSAGGWAPAGDGLLRLCFALLSAGSKPLARLGSTALTALIGRRPELARDAVGRLVTALAGGVSAEAHAEALGHLVAGCPLTVAESRAHLTDLLAHLGLLPLTTARRLLAALLPVLKICAPLKDQLVLTLRKLLVGKRCEGRQIAVCGLLLCLRHFRVVSSLPFSQASQNFSCAMSQVAADLGPAFPTSANEALCLELLGVLRRCLTQQAPVRATLYAGLHEVISRNPELAETIISMLLQQLKLFTDDSARAPPLRLAACVEVGEEVSLLEPLPQMLAALAACSRRVLAGANTDETEDEGPDVVAAREAERVLDDIAKRMMNVELDDFDLGKECDVGSSTEGRKNVLMLMLLQGVYEALLDHRCQSDFESDSAAATVLICIHQKLDSVAEFRRSKASTKGKKKDSAAAKSAAEKSASRDPATEPLCLSLRSVTRLLSALTTDANPAHHVSLEKLRSETKLTQHVANAARQLSGQLRADGECAGAEGANQRHLVELACRLAPALLKLAGAEEEELSPTCLEALADLLEAFKHHFPARMPTLLEETAVDGAGGLLTRCRLLLSAGCAARGVAPLLRLLLLAAGEASTEEQADLLSWSQQQLRQPPADGHALCRQLVELGLSLADRLSPQSGVARQVARAVHEQLGDLDESVQLIAADPPLGAVTERSAAGCLLALCSRLTGWLEAVDWLLAGCRAAAGATLDEQQAKQEAAVCSRVLALVAVLDELAQSAAPLGPDTDAVLKLLGRTYVSLAALVKYYAARNKHTKLTKATVCGKFERVLEACGRSLTPHVYVFITFTESQQRQQRQGKADPAVKRARVLRQTRLIPVLVCNIENFEKHLIALGKRTKLDLHAGVKLSTSRDFRIIQATLQAALERAGSSEEEEEEEGAENRDPRGADAPAGTASQLARSQLSQGVVRLTRPSQKPSKLSRSQKLSQPAAKRAKVEK